MNKKGFTLIEIIICITLVAIIGTTSTILVVKNKNTNFESVTNKILESAKVFANIEKDEDGNTYINGVYNGRRGVSIPLKTLVNKGYVKEDLANKVYEKTKTKKDEDQFILLLNTTETPEKRTSCKNNQITLKASWTIKEDKPIYLCDSGTSQITVDNVINIINNINVINVASNNVKYNIEKIPVSKEKYKELSKTLSSTELEKYTDKENGWFIYYNEKTDRAYSFFRGAVDNNYVELGNIGEEKLIWRVVWVRDDGQMKLVLDDTIPIELKDKSGNNIKLDSNDSSKMLTAFDNKALYVSLKEDINNNYGEFYCKNWANPAINYRDICEFIIKDTEVEQVYNGVNIFSDFSNFFSLYLNNVWKNKVSNIFDKNYLVKNNNFCSSKFDDVGIPNDYYDSLTHFYNKDYNFDCKNYKNYPEYEPISKYETMEIGELSVGDLSFAGTRDSSNYLYSLNSYHITDLKYSGVIDDNLQNHFGGFYYDSGRNIINIKDHWQSYQYILYDALNYYYIYDNKHIDKFPYLYPINLKPAIIVNTKKITFSGDGTKENPYTIQES